MIDEIGDDKISVRARSKRAAALSKAIIEELEAEIDSPLAIVVILSITVARYYLRTCKKTDGLDDIIAASFVSAQHMEDGKI